ncbi:MAG: undecaprenyl-diphosphate phosphatase [Myxococcota bacterium]
MSPLLAAVILGIVQGLTEFLPVSSSGHLVLFQQYLPVSGDPVAFDLVLHIGTLLPVIVVYRNDLWSIVRDLFVGEGPMRERPGVRLLLLMFIGSIPTALIGLALEDVFEQLFANALSVGVAFALTGAILWGTRALTPGDEDERTMPWWKAVMIGIAQGIAITPGISRSGSTIAAGLFLGLDREVAARYSFLLSIPAILGAFLLKARDLESAAVDVLPLAAGFVAAAVSGYLALVVLLRLVRSGDFSWFALYLWPLAVLAVGAALV